MTKRKTGRGPEGSRVRYGPTGRAQRIKTGGSQWSDEAEEAFFDHLGATCNVKASAAAVGFTTFTVYRQRRLRPEFAARWQAVLEQGYAALEMALVQAALDSFDGVDFGEDRPIPKMTVEQAMNLLKLHRAEARREQDGRPGRRPIPRGIEYYRESIRRKVAAIRRADGDADGEGLFVRPERSAERVVEGRPALTPEGRPSTLRRCAGEPSLGTNEAGAVSPSEGRPSTSLGTNEAGAVPPSEGRPPTFRRCSGEPSRGTNEASDT